MTIDRRAFVAGTTLLAFAPALGFLPAPLSPPAANPSHLVFMIDGWSVPSDSDRRRGVDQGGSLMANRLAMMSQLKFARTGSL